MIVWGHNYIWHGFLFDRKTNSSPNIHFTQFHKLLSSFTMKNLEVACAGPTNFQVETIPGVCPFLGKRGNLLTILTDQSQVRPFREIPIKNKIKRKKKGRTVIGLTSCDR